MSWRGPGMLLMLAQVGCGPPMSLHGSPPPHPPVQPSGFETSRAAESDALALTLPTHVDVLLAGVEKRATLEWTESGERVRTARPAGSGVSMDGRSPVSQGHVHGPVVIDGRTYPGELFVQRHPQSGLRALVRVPFEAYIEGVVSSELAIWSATSAELEAQAIAARTFAVATLQQRRAAGMRVRLTDGVLDQAFRGRYVPGRSDGARRAGRRLAEAVDSTRGVVLVRGDRLEEARYHAACGGRTASFTDVFRREVAERGARGPAAIACRSCTARARAESAARAPDASRPLGWIVDVSTATLAQVGREFELDGPPTRIAPARIDNGGRWLEVVIYDASGNAKRIDFDALRRVVGYTELKSGVIAATVPRAGAPLGRSALRIQGRGRGHGVGLCQEGMRDLGNSGWSSEQILAHYYSGARLVTAGVTAAR